MTAAVRLHHVALWSRDIERLAAFYAGHFAGQIGPRYHNPKRGFHSRFVTLADGIGIELMQLDQLADGRTSSPPPCGWAHIALVVGDEAAVDARAQALSDAGIPLIGPPRRTGDGYYEAVIADPDGNLIELVAALDG